MKSRVECEKGLPCAFTVRFKKNGVADPIPDRYTEAKFQVRTKFDETLPALLSITHEDGITINHAEGTVDISIGATKTEAMEILDQPTVMAAALRLYDPTNADDRRGAKIPFLYLPEAVDD